MMRLSKVCCNLIQKHLISKIKYGGPITVNEYMKTVLLTPTGFYMKQDMFGQKGHFITSPEISQIFGELIAVWMIHEWQRFDRLEPFNIVELGPGRGSLMSDICRVVSKLGCDQKNTTIHLVEISPYLKQVQVKLLCPQADVEHDNQYILSQSGLPIRWYNHLDEVPICNGFTVYVANEFFDALPIHKFQKNSDGHWREILIDVDEKDNLRYIISHHPTPSSSNLIGPEYDACDHLELSPETFVILDKIVDRINANPGCALMCDYGFDDPNVQSRDTFRAFKDNQLWDPLKMPGEADLTADIDFDAIKKHLKDRAITFGPTSQANYLNNMGIGVRLGQILQKSDDRRKTEILESIKTLMCEMGERFKFFAICPKNSQNLYPDNPPGFFDICTDIRDST